MEATEINYCAFFKSNAEIFFEILCVASFFKKIIFEKSSEHEISSSYLVPSLSTTYTKKLKHNGWKNHSWGPCSASSQKLYFFIILLFYHTKKKTWLLGFADEREKILFNIYFLYVRFAPEVAHLHSISFCLNPSNIALKLDINDY